MPMVWFVYLLAALRACNSLGMEARQTPEELGFTDEGDADEEKASLLNENACLDLGAKGFPLPVWDMLQDANWDPVVYFQTLQSKGYADDALQMTGPQEAILKTDCMKENFRGRTKHIFVGDSQMMTLRNAFHRQNKCPEIWYNKTTPEQALRQAQKVGSKVSLGRLHSPTEQGPQVELPKGCSESGIASFIFWDAWAAPDVPVHEIRKEMEDSNVDPKEGDTVVVWLGSNYIPAKRRSGVLLEAAERLRLLGARLIWDTPTFQDSAIMAATTSHDAGRDLHTEVPIVYSAISRRKDTGELGSNEFQSEKALLKQGIDISMTKRWQLTNRYRGLQCDGIHTDMRGRDPLFYSQPCPVAHQRYGESVYCNWVEPFEAKLEPICMSAMGLDDLVLQSGLYAMCAGHEKPFCYQHTDEIR